MEMVVPLCPTNDSPVAQTLLVQSALPHLIFCQFLIKMYRQSDSVVGRCVKHDIVTHAWNSSLVDIYPTTSLWLLDLFSLLFPNPVVVLSYSNMWKGHTYYSMFDVLDCGCVFGQCVCMCLDSVCVGV